MNRTIVILSCLAVQPSIRAIETQFRPEESIEQQFTQRLRIQQERIEEFEAFVSWKKRNVEHWYANSIERLKESAERRALKIPLKVRLLWTEFWKMRSEDPYPDGYYRNPGIKFYKEHDRLRLAMQGSFFLNSFRDLLLNEDFGEFLARTAYGHVDDPLRPAARDLLPIVESFQWQATLLDRRRKARLTRLDELRKNLASEARKTALTIEKQAKRFEFGVVSAISYSSTDSFCMIKGVDGMVRVGDKIGNVTISKIHEEKVEFNKQGQIWTQSLGGAAAREWQLKKERETGVTSSG